MEKRVTISEAARQLSLEPHVLRYWEVELNLDISRNNQGHRFYTEDDITLLREIKDLKEKGFLLKSIKEILPDLGIIKSMSERELKELRDELNFKFSPQEVVYPKKEHKAQVMQLRPNTYSVINNNSPQDKLHQFEALMRNMIRSTYEEMCQESEERIYEKVTDKLLKEMEYLSRQKEELHEQQIKLLKSILSEVTQGNKEIAATDENIDIEKKNHNKKLFAKKK